MHEKNTFVQFISYSKLCQRLVVLPNVCYLEFSEQCNLNRICIYDIRFRALNSLAHWNAEWLREKGDSSNKTPKVKWFCHTGSWSINNLPAKRASIKMTLPKMRFRKMADSETFFSSKSNYTIIKLWCFILWFCAKKRMWWVRVFFWIDLLDGFQLNQL